MKKRFYEGEEVVCIDKEMKPIGPVANDAPNLIYNNLYVIRQYHYIKHGYWFVSVVGIPGMWLYSEDTFAPITQIEELMEEVNEIVLENQIKRIHEGY